MLIVVSGQDSYRALEKVRELERAYREKYDPEGRSVESLPMGAEGVERLLTSTASCSLFSKRRFIRIDNLVTSCPKAKRDAILRALARDVDTTIVVSREEGAVTPKELKGFSEVPKYFQYDFPTLERSAFTKWAHAHAASLGITDEKAIISCIESSNGDTWFFSTECQKLQAGGSVSDARDRDVVIYEVLDAYLMKSPRRYSLSRMLDDSNALIAQLPNQMRSFALVSSGHREGIHPFVAQKLSKMRLDDPSGRFAHLMTAFVWSRTGFASADEVLDILG